MNIKRGLIRVWIVISFLWVAVFLWLLPVAISKLETIATSQTTLARLKQNAPEGNRTYPDSDLGKILRKLYIEKEKSRQFDIWKMSDDQVVARWGLLWFAASAVVPLLLFWALLPVGFWIASGFKGKQ